MSFEPFEQAMHERTEELLREELGDERFRALIEEGVSLGVAAAARRLSSVTLPKAVRLSFGQLVPRTQTCRAASTNGQMGDAEPSAVPNSL